MKAIERRHLKKNEFAAGVERVSTFVRENRDRAVITGLVVAVVVVGVGGYFFLRHRTNDQASEMFGEAMAVTEAQIAPPSSLPQLASRRQ